MSFIIDAKTVFVLVIGALNIILGAFVLLKNSKSNLNKAFGAMTLLVGLWSVSAFVFRAFPMGTIASTFGYILYDAAALLPPSFLIMALVFPPYSVLSKRIFVLLLAETLFLVVLISWPGLVIQGLVMEGNEKILIWGRFYLAYVLHQVLLFSIGYLVLVKKYFHAEGLQKQQVKYIVLGTIVPANLALTTNLLLPWFGVYEFYTWAGQGCMILLVLSSGYAILKHHLFDIKIITTEIFTVATSITLFVRIFLSARYSNVWVDWSIFLAVTVFGILLIRSVLKEVQQREELEHLTKQLETANAELKSLDEARAEFISIASHQLRTPPATIKWYLSAILSGDYGEIQPDAKSALEKTQRTNNSLISLIEDLLNVSRIERGKMEFLFEETDLLPLALTTLEQLQPIAREKKLELLFTQPENPLPPIMADREKLRQVMNNLVDNAIKYTKKGSVLVELFQDGDSLRFQVTDTGKGVSVEEERSIFAKFKRGRQSIGESAGLGLGLYVAKVIINEHKGKIWVESRGEGKGAKFIFTIPIHNNLQPTTLVNLAQTPAAAEQAKV